MSLPIGFFAPLPLPMMIPFMGIQSAVMAEQFGTMFQYGKRRISAMSNEEFNQLTFEKLQSEMTKQIKGMIPEMQNQIKAMQPMVKMIIEEFASYIKLATEAMPSAVVQSGLLGSLDPKDDIIVRLFKMIKENRLGGSTEGNLLQQSFQDTGTQTIIGPPEDTTFNVAGLKLTAKVTREDRIKVKEAKLSKREIRQQLQHRTNIDNLKGQLKIQTTIISTGLRIMKEQNAIVAVGHKSNAHHVRRQAAIRIISRWQLKIKNARRAFQPLAKNLLKQRLSYKQQYGVYY